MKIKKTNLQAMEKLIKNNSDLKIDQGIYTIPKSNDTNEKFMGAHMESEHKKLNNLSFAEAWNIASQSSLFM